MRFPNFIGGSYTSQSPLADQERTVNFYVEQIESPGASTKAALYPTPGVEEISTATEGPGLAHFAQGGREFAIIGRTFYEIGQYGALTSRGTVAVNENPGTISSNGDGGGQLFITSGGNGYLFDLGTNAFSTISALAGKATMGDQLDGYFIALDSSTSTVYLSDLLDGATWDPTQFFQRSIASDPWVSMKVANRYLYLFGSETSEVWYDAGTFPIPFEPHPSGLMQYGCAAPFSPEVVKGTVIWLAQTASGNGAVLRVSGFTPEEVSNNALQNAFNGYSTVADAIGDTYDDLGHTFYILTFKNANVTWVFDDDNGTWCERGTWIVENNAYDAWRPLFHAYAFGEHRMLDVSSAAVYRMSSSLDTDAEGREIRRMRRSPAILKDNERVFYSNFELMVEPGLESIITRADEDETVELDTNGLVASQVGYGNSLWSNADNILQNGTDYASGTCLPGLGDNLKPLIASNFGLSFPDDAVLVGIAVIVRAKTPSGGTHDCIVSPGVLSGGVFTATPTTYVITVSSQDTTFITGSNEELWGQSWTIADLEAPTFAVSFVTPSTETCTYNVYHLCVRVWCTIPTYVNRGPLVMMRYSNDGGKTWSAEQDRSAGATGEYDKRVRWTRCGSGRKRVFEVSMSDPAPWRVLDAFVDITPGADSQKAGM